ncbi:Protein SEED AND ROOT HAIR PROTECTIVE PROTEIN [Linum grandiflorum]
MAATRFLTESFLLVLFMSLALASATDHIVAVKPPTSYSLKPGFDLKPKPHGMVSRPDSVAKPVDVARKPAYGGYVSTPELEKLRLRMLQYREANRANQVVHGPKPDVVQHPKSQTSGIKPAPYVVRKAEDGFTVGVEGIVACKTRSDYFPLQGAEKQEKQVWSLTDERGYFFKLLPAHKDSDYCKAFLEKSPLKKCSFGTDVNKGMSGAKLSTYKILHDKSIKLYPVGPFFYSPAATQHKQPSITSGGY